MSNIAYFLVGQRFPRPTQTGQQPKLRRFTASPLKRIWTTRGLRDQCATKPLALSFILIDHNGQANLTSRADRLNRTGVVVPKDDAAVGACSVGVHTPTPSAPGAAH
jgi:hypothetical protein